MHRRIANSHKKRKAQLKRKRAVKRGDTSPPPAPVHDRSRRRPFVKANSSQVHPENVEVVASARRLQSAFIKLPKEFLNRTSDLATALPLERPISGDAALLKVVDSTDASGVAAVNTSDANPTSDADPVDEELDSNPSHDKATPPLTCPRRPEWEYGMTKETVSQNEEERFDDWLEQTDDDVDTWFLDQAANQEQTGKAMPHAPTTFERNIEVWRQLWRVTEISQILLILLDSRCPLLHYPPSLSAYLSSITQTTRIILVLTKVDIAGPTRTEAWSQFFKTKYPGLRVIQVESYPTRDSDSKENYEPHLTKAFRKSLVDMLREIHEELLEPPEEVKNDAEKLGAWKPNVKRSVDWEAVLNASGEVHHAAEDAIAASEDNGANNASESEALTIGLIGQPNVGKSSLLNALFGTTKVRASRTPGKTKHFQTLFWTPQVRLVDCPGLVFPNYTPMEAQVLSGILPISRVSFVPSCIHYLSRLLPLETIFELEHPRTNEVPEQPKEDKRTWRGERAKEREREEREAREQEERRRKQWTAMDILVAFALKKAWVTAQAGRPDTNRAGNYILRAVAESRVRWGFWPPETPLSLVEENQSRKGDGIWIPSDAPSFDWSVESDDEHDDDVGRYETDSESGVEDDSQDEGNWDLEGSPGKFDALVLNDLSLEGSDVEGEVQRDA